MSKSNDQMIKSNYRPITILSVVATVYERLISVQIVAYSIPFLSPYLCGFCEGYNTQQALVRLLQKSKPVLDRKGFAVADLMDLSKEFDCLNHELLCTKLSAYGFCRSALKLIYSYLNERQQSVKLNGSLSTSKQASVGFPQVSVLGPLLFNICINDFILGERY